MLLKVLKYPDPVLRKVCKEVDLSKEKNLLALTNNMLETMYANDGVGLAAPQIGLSKRIVVIDVRDKEDVLLDDDLPEEARDILLRNPRVLINPVLSFPNNYKIEGSEGCLSVESKKVLNSAGRKAKVSRYRDVLVEYLNLQGEKCSFTASNNLLAVCVQHEVDHLNGKLFIDYLPEEDLVNR